MCVCISIDCLTDWLILFQATDCLADCLFVEPIGVHVGLSIFESVHFVHSCLWLIISTPFLFVCWKSFDTVNRMNFNCFWPCNHYFFLDSTSLNASFKPSTIIASVGCQTLSMISLGLKKKKKKKILYICFPCVCLFILHWIIHFNLFLFLLISSHFFLYYFHFIRFFFRNRSDMSITTKTNKTKQTKKLQSVLTLRYLDFYEILYIFNIFYHSFCLFICFGNRLSIH